MNLVVNLIIWGALLVITVAIWLYRRALEAREDHYIHLHGDDHDSQVWQKQSSTGQKVNTLSRAARTLIIVLVLYGLAIAAFQVYAAWNNTGGG